MTRYEQFFGTARKAAQTVEQIRLHCTSSDGGCIGCPINIQEDAFMGCARAKELAVWLAEEVQ